MEKDCVVGLLPVKNMPAGHHCDGCALTEPRDPVVEEGAWDDALTWLQCVLPKAGVIQATFLPGMAALESLEWALLCQVQ